MLAPRNLKSADECFLEAVSRIRVVAQKPVRSLPYNRPVPFHNYLPINCLQAILPDTIIIVVDARWSLLQKSRSIAEPDQILFDCAKILLAKIF